MSSKREEERNEKIIRGLMKLPPNRRCINCNSLGPQYVCTTFWTFVCMACSGIHREFTHRVKSVSMSKFTTQEVEVLQTGGNQRARETYLKNWDHQRQRLPDNSNADKVREFIKTVYVQKKYALGNATDKPPNDNQNHGSSEAVAERANSYHSYSQSPPYDYQYEERRYGKLPLAFTGKSASVKGLHTKASSFVYSPGRFSDHMFEDRFANDVSAPRASDFSVSSGGDPFRSPNSPQFQHLNPPPGGNLSPGRQHQRATSFGSVKSVDSNSMSVKSYTSSGLGENVSENGQVIGSQLDKASTPLPSVAESTKPPIDLFQLPGAPTAQPISTFHQPSQTYSSTQPGTGSGARTVQSFDTFQPSVGAQSQPTTGPLDLSTPKNEGWASFDNPTPAAKTTKTITSSEASELAVKNEGITQPSTSMQWPPYPPVVEQHTLSISSPWQDDLKNVVENPPWNAFPEANPLDKASTSSADNDRQPQPLEELRNDGNYTSTIPSGSSDFGFPGNIGMAPAYSSHIAPVIQEEAWNHISHQKSANPFDLPYDSEFDTDDMFMNMSSLQGTLPDIGVSQPWLPTDHVPTYLPTDHVPTYLPTPAGTQLQNPTTQGHVASTGGNPFA